MQQLWTLPDCFSTARRRGWPDSDGTGTAGLFRAMVSRFLDALRRRSARPARLALIERIALGPKHALLLVEAEGVRLLVATSQDGAAAFFPLQRSTVQEEPMPAEDSLDRDAAAARRREQGAAAHRRTSAPGRISW